MEKFDYRYSMITPFEIKQAIKQQQLDLLQEFVRSLPLPISSIGYKYIKVKSIEGISINIWGRSHQEIWDELQRFIGIRIFI